MKKTIRHNLITQVIRDYTTNDLMVDSNNINVLKWKDDLFKKLKNTFSFEFELKKFEMYSNYVIKGQLIYQSENGDWSNLLFTYTYMDDYEDKDGFYAGFRLRKPSQQLYSTKKLSK